MADARNPRVQALVKRWRRRDGEGARSVVRRLVEATLREATFVKTPPPFDPVAIGSVRGVKRIEPAEGLLCDAALRSEDDGFVIAVSPELSPVRRNFSVLHEVAHTFFWEASRGLPPLTRSQQNDLKAGYREEEDLCDFAAAEFLLPRKTFKEALEGVRGLRWQTVQKVASAFGASREATIRRVVETTGLSVLVERWTPDVGDGWSRKVIAYSSDLRAMATAQRPWGSRTPAFLEGASRGKRATTIELGFPGRQEAFRAEIKWVPDRGRLPSCLVLISPNR